MSFSELNFIIKNSEGLNKWTGIGCFEQTEKIIVRELCAYVLNEKTYKVSGLFRIIENQQFEHLQTACILTSLSVSQRPHTLVTLLLSHPSYPPPLHRHCISFSAAVIQRDDRKPLKGSLLWFMVTEGLSSSWLGKVTWWQDQAADLIKPINRK